MKSGIFFVTTFFKIEITPSKRRRMVVNHKAKLKRIDFRIRIRRHFEISSTRHYPKVDTGFYSEWRKYMKTQVSPNVMHNERNQALCVFSLRFSSEI